MFAFWSSPGQGLCLPHRLLGKIRDSLGCTATQFSIPARIIIVNDYMGDLWVVKVCRDLASVIPERLGCRDQAERSVSQ